MAPRSQLDALSFFSHTILVMSGFKPSKTTFSQHPDVTLFSQASPKTEQYLAETFEIPFDQSSTRLGTTATCHVPLKGDIIRRMTVRSTLPQLYTPLGPGYVYPYYSDQVDGGVYLSNGTLAIQPGDFVGYFNTQQLNYWATNFVGYSNLSVAYDSTLNKFVFTSPVYSNVVFHDENSASFWGFDIRTFDFVTGGYYGYNFTNGTLVAPLTLVQAGWIRGFTPPPSIGFSYKDSVGTKLIKEARLLIGGQTIDRLTSERLYLEQDLSIPYENQAALTVLEGKNDTSGVYTPREYYTKLTFNTDKLNIGKLTQQDVSLEVDFEQFANLPSNLITTNGFLDGQSWVTSNIQALAGNPGQNFDPEWAIGWKNYIITGPLLNASYRLYNQNTGTFYNWTPNFRGVTRFTINGNTLYSSGYRAGTLSKANINTILAVSNTPWTTSTYNFFSGWTATPYYEGGNYIYAIVSDARYVYMFCSVNYYIIGTTYTNLLNGTLAGDMHTWTINYKFFNVTAPLSATNNTAMLSFLSNFASGYDTTTTASNLPTTTTLTNPGTVSELTLSFASVTGVSIDNQVFGGITTYITGPIRVIAISGLNVTIQFGPQNVPTIPSGTFVSFQNGPNISTQTTIGSNMQLTMTAYYTAVQQSGNRYIPGVVVHNNTMWLRYDSFGDFNSASSYSYAPTASGLPASMKDIFPGVYDTISLPNTNYYFGSTFDGRYIYFPTFPIYIGRLDTQNFTSTSAYTQVNGASLNPNPVYFNEGQWQSDGRYLYVSSNSTRGSNGRFQRYDSTKPISSQSAWEYYTTDTAIRASDGEVSHPGGFDGKYIYYFTQSVDIASGSTDFSRKTLIHIYDTSKSFNDVNSWKWISIYTSGNTLASDGTRPNITMLAHRTDLSPSDPYYNAVIRFLRFIPGERYVYIIEADGRGFKVTLQDFIQFNPLTMTESFDASVLVKYEKYAEPDTKPMALYGQTDMNTFIIPAGQTKGTVQLEFTGPIRELWISPDTPLSRVTLVINGEILIDDDDTTARIIRPYEYHTNQPTGNTYVYSFSMDPEIMYPSGTVNFSRLPYPMLTVQLQNPVSTPTSIRVYAKNFNILVNQYGLAGLKFNSSL